MDGATGSLGEPKLRLLVVEDSYLAARSLVRLVESMGAEVVGPASSVAAALDLVASRPCDGAILDINLGDESVEPVAARLDDLRRPFFFVTGYASPQVLGPKFRGRRMLHKPVDPAQLRSAIVSEFREGSSTPVAN